MTANKLNTDNPDHIIYRSEVVQIEILGGIRLEGLDRMRATVKIAKASRAGEDTEGTAIRHNLDLYNDLQVEKYSRRAAEKLEVGTSHIEGAISELTHLLEQYRLEEIRKAESEEEKKKQLTQEEIKAARSFLESPYLLKKTGELIGSSGVTGEEANRLLMYLIFTSRKRQHPLHVISLGSSGTGKTHLQEKVSELIPEEDKLEITVLSENAFYYFDRRELKNKLILIEDLDGAENVLYPLRELQSKKRISKTVAHKDSRGNTKTVHLRVEGPVSVAGCTTREKIYEDNANRSFLIYLDESKEQDERIMEYQRKLSAGIINTEEEKTTAELLRNCQRILQPVAVKNPYAPLLKLPQEVFKPRRTNSHYLAFIEVVTFYHQYQRKWVNAQTGEVIYEPGKSKSIPTAEAGAAFIETTLEDIREANKLMKEILLRKSDELSGACRSYFEKLKAYLQDQQGTTFTNKEIRSALRIPYSTVKRYHLELSNFGLIQVAKNENRKYKGYRYEITSTEEYQKLQSNITGVLDKILEQLKAKNKAGQRLNGLPVAQKQSEPPNPLKTSMKSATARQPTQRSKQEENPILKEGLQNTLGHLLQHPGTYHTAEQAARLTGKSKRTESRYLKELAEAGLAERIWKDKKYQYKAKQNASAP